MKRYLYAALTILAASLSTGAQTLPPPVPIVNVYGVAGRYGALTVPVSVGSDGTIATDPGAGGSYDAVPIVNYVGMAGLGADGNYHPVSLDGTGALATSGGGGGAVLPPSLAVGLIGDWNFYQQTGTTLTDSSGNGNNGTLTGGATFTTTGLPLTATSGASLPAAVNAAQSFVVAIYVDTLGQNTSPYTNLNTVVVSSAGTPGTNLLLLWTNPAAIGGAPSPAIYSSGGTVTGCSNLVTGYHVIGWTLGTSGTSLDHFYVDGVECTYQAQNANAGTQTSGSLSFGAATTGGFAGNGIPSIFYRARAYDRQITATEVQELTQFFNADVSSRGVILGTAPIMSPLSLIFGLGDSITYGLGVLTPWENLLSLTNQPTYTIKNYGVPSVTVQQINASEPNRVAPQCRTSSGPANVILLAGTNDFSVNSYGNTAQAVWNDAAGTVVSLAQAGCRVFVGTMLSRTGSPSGSGTTYDQYKNTYDALILTNAKAVGAVGVVDFAANPLLGADLASTNPAPTACGGGACFQSDGIHPTQAGQQLMANAASNVLNYYSGYNIGNPNTVTATTYQIAAGDGAVTAAPTGNAAYTAPDCTGVSGVAYVIANPQSAHTLTITGGSSQPINGLTSAITIASNSTATLRAVANSKVTGGCHWSM